MQKPRGVRRGSGERNQLDMAGSRDRKYTHPHIFLLSHVTAQKDSARQLAPPPCPGLMEEKGWGSGSESEGGGGWEAESWV